MEYFNLLEFKKEPFSNSPEPEFLFAAPQHNICLQRLELAVRLRRGLNIVIGDVGTGKTTLCRKLIQNLAMPVTGDAPIVETFLLLDPAVAGRLDFVRTVATMLGISDVWDGDSEWQIKEKIKNFLFEKGVQEQKNIVLVIDEGQKIPDDCLEILREFLNYETNSFKLLQIVIFAQPELRKNLAARANLLDRVNYLYHLKPLSFMQTKAMIEHRISIASIEPDRGPLFTIGGMIAVYTATRGYPRKVVSLCHQVLLMMMIRGKRRAGWFLVRRCAGSPAVRGTRRISWAALGLLTIVVLAFFAVLYGKGLQDNFFPTHNRPVLSGIGMSNESAATAPAKLYGPQNNIKGVVPPQSAGSQFSEQTGVIPDAANVSAAHEIIPDYLGTLSIKKGMTVWQVLETVYGNNRLDVTRRFAEINPRIKNIDFMLPGTVIQLPAVPGNTHALKPETILVFLENSKNLEDVYNSFLEKKNLSGIPEILFVPFYNQADGHYFAIVLNQNFKTLEEAGEAVRRLPPELAASAQVLSQWSGNTIFFNTRLAGN
jgi:general secretion pathway protein A